MPVPPMIRADILPMVAYGDAPSHILARSPQHHHSWISRSCHEHLDRIPGGSSDRPILHPCHDQQHFPQAGWICKWNFCESWDSTKESKLDMQIKRILAHQLATITLLTPTAVCIASDLLGRGTTLLIVVPAHSIYLMTLCFPLRGSKRRGDYSHNHRGQVLRMALMAHIPQTHQELHWWQLPKWFDLPGITIILSAFAQGVQRSHL